MAEFLNKLSSYHLLNYLIPGILFVIFVDKFTPFSFEQKDIVLGLFFYYFIGLVISRIGSLIIEPVLKKISFIKFQNYDDFLVAKSRDPKIEVLSETNNMYRSLSSLFLALLLLKGFGEMEKEIPGMAKYNLLVLFIFLLIIFLYSYRKQASYVSRSILSATGAVD